MPLPPKTVVAAADLQMLPIKKTAVLSLVAHNLSLILTLAMLLYISMERVDSALLISAWTGRTIVVHIVFHQVAAKATEKQIGPQCPTKLLMQHLHEIMPALDAEARQRCIHDCVYMRCARPPVSFMRPRGADDVPTSTASAT